MATTVTEYVHTMTVRQQGTCGCLLCPNQLEVMVAALCQHRLPPIHPPLVSNCCQMVSGSIGRLAKYTVYIRPYTPAAWLAEALHPPEGLDSK